MRAQSSNNSQKLAYMQSNIDKLPQQYRNHIQTLPNLLTNNQSCGLIKLQTFYRCTQPALYYLQWDQPNNQNFYPVALVISNVIQEGITNVGIQTNLNITNNNNSIGGKQYGISYKFITWIQSGGARCITFKPNLQKTNQKIHAQIEKFVQMSHCAIFGDFMGEFDQKTRTWMEIFMNVAKKYENYPVMFIKNSVRYAMEIYSGSKLEIKKLQNGLTELYISYQSQLFKGVDLSLRLQFQNTKRIPYPYPPISVTNLNQNYSFLRISSTILSKSNQQQPITLQHKQAPIYFILNDPCSSQLPQNMKIWHNLIINYMNVVKKVKKEVDQKKLQKYYVANWKVVQIGDKTWYKISNN